MGDVQEAILLNRPLRLYPPSAERKRTMGDADLRHAEILVSQMGLNNENTAVHTPVVRTTDVEDSKS